MKVVVGIPTKYTIPDDALQGLARRARARGVRTLMRGVPVDELIEQARLDGLLTLPDDYSTELDDERIFLRGEITTTWKELKRQQKRKKQRKGSR